MIGIKNIFSLTLILVVIFTLILVLTKKENTFLQKTLVAQNFNLTTDVEACKRPVKFIGSAKGKACFSCEHGTENQHIVCTENITDKTTLFDLVQSTDA